MWTDFIRQHARYQPNSPAIFVEIEDRELSYADLDREISHWAAHFYHRGVRKGDRVALLAQNRLEHITMFFACTRLGAIFVPLNYRLAVDELKEQLDRIQARLFYGVHASLHCVDPEDDPPVHGTDFPEVSIQPDDVLLMLFTSGSTGIPKGVMLHAEMLLWNIINTHFDWALQAGDSTVVHTPFFHTGGYNVTTLPVLRLGGKVVLADCFEPARMLDTIQQHRISVFFAIPTMFAMMADQPGFDKADLSSLRFCISGGAACPASLLEIWRKRGAPLKQGFGLTEVGPNCFFLTDDQAQSRPDTVGLPMTHSQIKLLNENGQAAVDGEIGELCIKGPHVCKGYWNNHKAFEAVFIDGYFHTGDLMKRDPDGFYYVVGRKKEMYISGGENVYPGEVVRKLLQHPQIHDAIVLPVPHQKWGEVGYAFLRSDQDFERSEIRDFLNDKLSRYKHPHHIKTLSEFPLLPNNKVDRQTLVGIALKEVNPN